MAIREKLKQHENLYFAVTNKKVIFGTILFLTIICLGIFGPMVAKYDYEEFAGPGMQPPSNEYWFGTTMFGRDVFAQSVYGLRSTIQVGLYAGSIAALIGLTIGFVSGYHGGKMLDEFLMGITNVILVFPTMVLLILLSAFLENNRGIGTMAVIIGMTIWPWVARAVRSQTLSLKTQEFVNLSRISAAPLSKILIEDIAANMLSYVVMVFILLFNGTILTAVGLEYLGLGPTTGASLGLVMQDALNWNALHLGMWWWGLIPGLIITLMIVSLYFVNTGLDEVFNPRLREM